MDDSAVRRLDDLASYDAFVSRLAASLVADPGAADDAAQEARFAFWRAADGEAIQNARGLLRRMVGRFASNRRREEARRAARERNAARPEAGPTDHVVEREEARARLWAAVEALDEPLRRAVHLRWFDGRPPREVARTLGVPVETVKTRLKRAQARLRESLEREYGGRDAWIAAMTPLARGGVGSAGAGLGAGVGGLIVATKLKWIGVAAAAIAAAWLGARDGMTGASATKQAVGATSVAAAGVDGRAAAARGADDERSASREVAAVPFADDAPAAEFVVLAEPDRRPVRGVETTLVRFDGGVDRATTNDAGAARFAPSVGAAQLVVRAERRPPVVFNVAAAAGRTELTLQPGATLRGRVTIDGAAPTRPVALSALGLAAAGSRSWGAATLAAVQGAARPDGVELDTDAEGRFEIAGLERTIGAPAYLRARNAALDVEPRLQKASGLYGHAALPSLDGEFVLPLLTAPRIRGRLRAHDGTAPAMGALLELQAGWDPSETPGLRFADGGSTACELAADGRFDVPLPRGPEGTGPTLVTFVARAAPGAPATSFAFERAELADRDVGDLTLPATRRVTLRCVDAHGAVVTGAEAVATTTDGAAPFSGGAATSDAEGRIALELPLAGETSVRVTAGGFDRADLRLAPDGPRERDVVLRMGGRLVVNVVDAAGMPARGARIELVYDQPPIEGFPQSSADGLERGRLRVDQSRARSAARPVEASGWSDETGVFALHGLRPGSTATVVLSGGDRGRALTKTAAIDADRPAVVDVRMIGEPHEFAVRLVRPDGGPGGGLVTFVAEDGAELFEATSPDVDGAYRVRGVPWTAVRLRVNSFDLFAPIDVALKPTDGGEPVVVRMAPALRAACDVVNEAGEPVTGLEVKAEGRRFHRLEEDAGTPGRYVVAGVGANESVPVSFDYAGRVFERKLVAGAEPLRIVVPSVGGCEVVLGNDPAPEADFLVTLRRDPRDMPLTASTFEKPADGPAKAIFRNVPAGSYRLEATRFDGSRSTPVGKPRDVEIRARETTTVRLSP